MKVIQVDNLNRDYQPERLITVAISENIANIIANKLNEIAGTLEYYKVVEDNYQLDLQSMYDVTDIATPNSFYINQLGLNALLSEKNIVIQPANNPTRI